MCYCELFNNIVVEFFFFSFLFYDKFLDNMIVLLSIRFGDEFDVLSKLKYFF